MKTRIRVYCLAVGCVAMIWLALPSVGVQPAKGLGPGRAEFPTAIRTPQLFAVEGLSPLQVSLSPSGQWLAVNGFDEADNPRVNVYAMKNRKLVAAMATEEGTGASPSMRASWHPWKPVIAIWRGLALESDLELLNVQTGKSTPSGSGTSGGFDWLPNGKIFQGWGSAEHIAGLWQDGWRTGSVTIGRDWSVAAMRGLAHSINGPGVIDIYQKLRGRMAYQRVGRLSAEKKASGEVTSFPTEPGFLSNKRLAYIRVFLDPDGNRKRAELWTCRQNGLDQRIWASLPAGPMKLDRKNYGSMPGTIWEDLTPAVSWSRDGKTIVCLFMGDVCVMQVKPPK
jgi:hypothetical protein